MTAFEKIEVAKEIIEILEKKANQRGDIIDIFNIVISSMLNSECKVKWDNL